MDLGLQRGFVKTDNTGFNFRVSGTVAPGEVYIIRMPLVTANRRGVNDIGWQIDGADKKEAKLYATLSDKPEENDAIWQEIRPDEGINKTATAIKFVGGSGTSKVWARVILN